MSQTSKLFLIAVIAIILTFTTAANHFYITGLTAAQIPEECKETPGEDGRYKIGYFAGGDKFFIMPELENAAEFKTNTVTKDCGVAFGERTLTQVNDVDVDKSKMCFGLNAESSTDFIRQPGTMTFCGINNDGTCTADKYCVEDSQCVEGKCTKQPRFVFKLDNTIKTKDEITPAIKTTLNSLTACATDLATFNIVSFEITDQFWALIAFTTIPDGCLTEVKTKLDTKPTNIQFTHCEKCVEFFNIYTWTPPSTIFNQKNPNYQVCPCTNPDYTIVQNTYTLHSGYQRSDFEPILMPNGTDTNCHKYQQLLRKAKASNGNAVVLYQAVSKYKNPECDKIMTQIEKSSEFTKVVSESSGFNYLADSPADCYTESTQKLTCNAPDGSDMPCTEIRCGTGASCVYSNENLGSTRCAIECKRVKGKGEQYGVCNGAFASFEYSIAVIFAVIAFMMM